MAAKAGRATEAHIGLAAMQILALYPNGATSVHSIKRHIPGYVKLTVADRAPSPTRAGEEMWEQQVRNLKSHSTTPGNPFCEGFITHASKGTWQITAGGRAHLKHKGLHP